MKHADLKDVIKELNKLELAGIEKLRTVGVKGVDLEENFLAAIDAVDDAGLANSLPDSIVAAYNELTQDSPEEPEEAEEAPKEAEEAPKEAPKEAPDAAISASKKKAAAAGRGSNKGASRSRYGHVQDADSGRLDDLLFAGNTVAAIMETLGVKRTRVVNHAKHLKNNKGLSVVETKPEGKDVKLNDTHFQVTEEFWTKD